MLTEAALKQSPDPGSDIWLTDAAPRGQGRLKFRISPNGSRHFYFQYTGAGKRRITEAIGLYAQGSNGGLTLAQARAFVDRRRRELRGVELPSEPVRQQRSSAEAPAPLTSPQARDVSLRRLLALYVEKLQRLKKQSARDVETLFNRTILKNELADRPACGVLVEELRDVIASMSKGTPTRDQGKLRSYLRAAYEFGIGATYDVSAPDELKHFELLVNPASAIRVPGTGARPRSRTLTSDELLAYLGALSALPSVAIRRTLEMHLFLGAQRPAQLVRLCKDDVDLTDGWIILSDPKGRRSEPVDIWLPLSPRLIEILRPLHDGCTNGPYVFSTDGGKTAIHPTTLSATVKRMVDDLYATKKVRSPFQLRDLRRAFETIATDLGISKEVRARLQSHDLGGVQNRHYNRSEFAIEKKKALAKWESHLKRLAEKVKRHAALAASS